MAGGRFNEPADYDHDGCVTPEDVRRLVAEGWDLDGDQDVDRDDLDLLLHDQGKLVSESHDGTHCDFDQDGKITSNDVQMLAVFCTRPQCATQSEGPNSGSAFPALGFRTHQPADAQPR